jgi:hypothetical protein
MSWKKKNSLWIRKLELIHWLTVTLSPVINQAIADGKIIQKGDGLFFDFNLPQVKLPRTLRKKK